MDAGSTPAGSMEGALATAPCGRRPGIRPLGSKTAPLQGRGRRGGDPGRVPVKAEHKALRESLAHAEPQAPSSAAALGTMSEVIHFANDESLLGAEARSILDAKVPVFRANPAMRIVITG